MFPTKLIARDLGPVTFVDDERQVDATFAERNDLGRNLNLVAACRSVRVLDGLNVSLDLRLAVRTRWLGLDDSSELVVLDLAVAIEDDLIDQLCFLHRQRPACYRKRKS